MVHSFANRLQNIGKIQRKIINLYFKAYNSKEYKLNKNYNGKSQLLIKDQNIIQVISTSNLNATINKIQLKTIKKFNILTYATICYNPLLFFCVKSFF